jgi:hypothetical protein
MRAFALERQHGIDHMLDDTGAGDLSVLGDVANEDDGGPDFLAKRMRACAEPRTWSPCRARIRQCRSTWSGWNR